MLSISSNIQQVLGPLLAQIEFLTKTDVMRSAALGLLPVVHDRIHVEGKAADDSLISETGYSSSYLKYTRKKNNRTTENKVILSLTRQMENDFSVVSNEAGEFGLGFKNIENFKKAQYCETTYDKKIYGLTESERELAVNIVKQTIADALHQ